MKTLKALLQRLVRSLREPVCDDERLRILEVMRLREANLPQPFTFAARRDFDRALVQCDQCHYTQLCDELLAKGVKRGYGRFCPNTPYIEQLRRGSLKLD